MVHPRALFGKLVRTSVSETEQREILLFRARITKLFHWQPDYMGILARVPSRLSVSEGSRSRLG